MWRSRRLPSLMLGLVLVALVASACVPAPAPAPAAAPAAEKEPFIFGAVLVGPYNDHGWSEAHYSAGEYVEEKIPGTEMVWLDKLNPADRQGTTLDQVVSDMVDKGATVILTTSDDFGQDTVLASG